MNELKGKKVILLEPTDRIDTQFRLYEESGCALTVGPYTSEPARAYSPEQLIAIGNEYDAAVGMSREKFTPEILRHCNRLQIISKTGIGVDHIDLAAASAQGILIANTPGNHDLDVAEYTIGQMLALLKRYDFNERHMRGGGWRGPETLGGELYGLTVGLVGYGNIGRHVAKRLCGWDCRLIAYDPYVSQEKCDSFGHPVTMVDWETLFSQSDIISLHMMLNAETRGCVAKREFSLMKKTAYIINTSRGPLIDLPSLDWALESGEIAGAAIDTHAVEPVGPDYPLYRYDNVLLTPHCAGWAAGGLARNSDHAARNVIEALTGTPPKSTVNPDAIPLWKQRFGY